MTVLSINNSQMKKNDLLLIWLEKAVYAVSDFFT
jgi:hypothetical protein